MSGPHDPWDTAPGVPEELTAEIETRERAYEQRIALARDCEESTSDLRSWHLEYDCHGAPYTWRGEAANEAAADSVARHQLAHRLAGFIAAEATLTACLEC